MTNFFEIMDEQEKKIEAATRAGLPSPTIRFFETKLPDFKFRPLEGCEVPGISKNSFIDDMPLVKKDFYDILDEQEKHCGLAMAAFQNEELKKQWALSVSDLLVNMKELQAIFDSASTALMNIIYSGADKNVETDFNSVMINVRNSMNLTEAKNALKRITDKNKSVTACNKCASPMTVKTFKQLPESYETKWQCECGHAFTETKNK